MFALVLLIGSFQYQVVNDCKDFGAVGFPANDLVSRRTISACLTVNAYQRRLAAEHELHHICYHNHEHLFVTKLELQEHINHKFTEEESIEIVTQCIIDNRKKVYDVFEVR